MVGFINHTSSRGRLRQCCDCTIITTLFVSTIITTLFVSCSQRQCSDCTIITTLFVSEVKPVFMSPFVLVLPGKSHRQVPPPGTTISTPKKFSSIVHFLRTVVNLGVLIHKGAKDPYPY